MLQIISRKDAKAQRREEKSNLQSLCGFAALREI
jgi:hypothetical protein